MGEEGSATAREAEGRNKAEKAWADATEEGEVDDRKLPAGNTCVLYLKGLFAFLTSFHITNGYVVNGGFRN